MSQLLTFGAVCYVFKVVVITYHVIYEFEKSNLHYASTFSSILMRQKHQALIEHFSGVLPRIFVLGKNENENIF